jgi:hypothetical protein
MVVDRIGVLYRDANVEWDLFYSRGIKVSENTGGWSPDGGTFGARGEVDVLELVSGTTGCAIFRVLFVSVISPKERVKRGSRKSSQKCPNWISPFVVSMKLLKKLIKI